jgi:kynurenine formamidase
MRIRSFIIAYALVLAILLFADRRPGSTQQNRYSHVVDLSDAPTAAQGPASQSATQIIAPDALIPGTWTATQIPPERLVAPLIVIDLNVKPARSPQLSLDDIAGWESRHGMIPQGSVVAIRRVGVFAAKSAANLSQDAPAPFPIAHDAAIFLIEARNTVGFAVETSPDLSSDRVLANQLALHGNYVVEGAAHFTALPVTGSLIIVAPAVAPAKIKTLGPAPVRILAMVSQISSRS